MRWTRAAIPRSSWSRIGPIGIAGFVVLLGLEIPLFRTWRRDLLTGVLAVSGLGLVVAVYLGYVELDIIHALCPICFSTYVVDGLVFLLSLWLFLAGRAKPGTAPARKLRLATASPDRPLARSSGRLLDERVGRPSRRR